MLNFNTNLIFMLVLSLIVSSTMLPISYETIESSIAHNEIANDDKNDNDLGEDVIGYWKWFYSQRAYHTPVPDKAYMKAAMVATAPKQSSFSTSLLPNNVWQSIGPSPISAGGVNWSGRVSAIAFDPANQNAVYLGAAQGGVWKSINRGSTWIPLTDNQPSLATGSIAVDSSGNVYVGTGEGNHSCDSYYGAGILKSTNGGQTWTQLGASTFGSSTITKIVINYTSQNIILASTSYGNSAGPTNNCNYVFPTTTGVYRSIDGGNTWSLTLNPSASVSDVVIDPSNSQIVYAGVSGVGIYKSTNGGLTWNLLTWPISSQFGRISLTMSAQPIDTLVVAVDVFSNPDAKLLKSTNGGSTWSFPTVPTLSNGSTFCAGQCWYDLYISADPTNANILYAGGVNLFRSTNGGTTWTDLGGYSGFIHPDQHAIAFDPFSHTSIFVGNDGGVWSSSNANTCSPSSCWTNLNAGLTITQFQSIAAAATSSSLFIGGTQDNGVLKHTSSTIWSQIHGGDGGWTAIDPSNPSIMYDTHYIISPSRSDNGGSNWALKTSGLNLGDDSQFYIPMAMDIQHPSTLYLGTLTLYKTTNKGDTWSPIFTLSSNVFVAIAVAPSNDNYVYAGDNIGKIFVSTDGGQHFTEKDNGMPTSKYLTKITVDNLNPQHVYATFSGFGGEHVFYSANAGNNWSDITSNLPDIPTNTILVNNGIIYVGTDIGPYVSPNGGSSWSRLGTGFPTVAIFEFALTSDGNLLAATHGRSVWMITPNIVNNCIPPSTPGQDWTITGIDSCSIDQDTTVPANVIVQNGGTLTISGGKTLHINFSQYHLSVLAGGKVIIRAGGIIN